MNKVIKQFKYKKINTMSEFDKRKLFKEKQKSEKQLMDSYKYFRKNKVKRMISLEKIFTPFKRKEKLLNFNKNNSVADFPRKKIFFDTNRPVYIDNRKNKTKFSELNNVYNKNLFREIEQKILGNKRYNNQTRNKIDPRKLLIYKQYNHSGFDKHFMTTKSSPDIFAETKYTDIRDYKTRENNVLEENKFQTNVINKLRDKQSALSTLEYSNRKRKKTYFTKKFKYSRENILQSFADMNKNKSKVANKKYLIHRKKYNFIQKNYIMDIDDYTNLKKEVEKFNKNSLALLVKENGKLFAHIGSIISAKKFSEKYRDPLNNSFERELKEAKKNKEKNLIKLNILSGVDLLKDMDKELEKRKIIKKVIKGKSLLLKIKKLIIKKIEYLGHLQISFEEMLNNYKIAKTAFTYPQTENLIMAIRNKDYDSCCDILDKYKYIVLDYDYFHLTSLHWAAKLNFFEIIPKLIQYGAYVNEKNLWGNTPLHISVSQNFYETSIFLLLYLASPFIKNQHNKKPIDCSNDVQFNYMFKKIVDIHYKYSLSRTKLFYQNVQKEFANYVIFEFSNILNPAALSLIKDLKAYYH